MPQMIKRGKEFIRISPVSAGKLEYSSTDGRSWAVRFQPNSYIGDFLDLIDNGNFSPNDQRTVLFNNRR